jgi:predicted dehydrogenase
MGTISRKDFIKKSALGAVGLAVGSSYSASAFLKHTSPNDIIGIGVIGFGVRARQMVGRMGYYHPQAAPVPTGFDTISREERTRGYANQSDKCVQPFDKEKIRAVCDIYDDSLTYAGEMFDSDVKMYSDYRKMLDDKDIDCVMIYTPDHWHARMAIDAVDAGKDIFIEKCPTHNFREGVELKRKIDESDRIVQLNESVVHSPATKRMKEIIESGALGKVHLIRTYKYIPVKRRVWDWPVPSNLNTATINWKEFLGVAPYREFDPKRVIKWRCYWDYGTGVCGDLFSHTLAGINPIMDIHIPKTAIASGSVTALKDYFEVPDLYHSVYEYPEKELTLLFSANFASGNAPRSNEFIGTDASMTSRGNEIYIWGEALSDIYSEKMKTTPEGPVEIIKIEKENEMSALEYHFHEFFDAMRKRGKTSCDINFTFDEDIACHMGTEAFLQGKKVTWDSQKMEII